MVDPLRYFSQCSMISVKKGHGMLSHLRDDAYKKNLAANQKE